MLGELKNQGYRVNKKNAQRITQKLGLQVTSFTRKSRKYNSYQGKIGTIAPNKIRRRFKTPIPHQKITTDTIEFKYYEIDAKYHYRKNIDHIPLMEYNISIFNKWNMEVNAC